MEEIKLAIRNLNGLVWDWHKEATEKLQEIAPIFGPMSDGLPTSIDPLEESNIRARKISDARELYHSLNRAKNIVEQYLEVIQAIIHSKDTEIYGDKS